MNPVATFLPLVVFGGLFVAYFIWMSKKSAQSKLDGADALKDFFQQTGFRLATMPNAPVEEHVGVAIDPFAAFGGPQGQEWVRDCGGAPVRHFMRSVNEGNRVFYWCRWS